MTYISDMHHEKKRLFLTDSLSNNGQSHLLNWSFGGCKKTLLNTRRWPILTMIPMIVAYYPLSQACATINSQQPYLSFFHSCVSYNNTIPYLVIAAAIHMSCGGSARHWTSPVPPVFGGSDSPWRCRKAQRWRHPAMVASHTTTMNSQELPSNKWFIISELNQLNGL